MSIHEQIYIPLCHRDFLSSYKLKTKIRLSAVHTQRLKALLYKEGIEKKAIKFALENEY